MDADHLHHHPDGYRGWVRPGGRRGRWIEPFLLLLVAGGEAQGYALIAALNSNAGSELILRQLFDRYGARVVMTSPT